MPSRPHSRAALPHQSRVHRLPPAPTDTTERLRRGHAAARELRTTAEGIEEVRSAATSKPPPPPTDPVVRSPPAPTPSPSLSNPPTWSRGHRSLLRAAVQPAPIAPPAPTSRVDRQSHQRVRHARESDLCTAPTRLRGQLRLDMRRTDVRQSRGIEAATEQLEIRPLSHPAQCGSQPRGGTTAVRSNPSD